MPAEHQEVLAMAGTAREVRDMLAARIPASDEDEFFLAIRVPPADDDLLKLIVKVSTGIVGFLANRSKTPEQRDILAQWMAVYTAEMTPATPHLLKEAAMRNQARAAVLASGDWLRASEIAQLAGLSSANPSAQPNKWKRKGQIFAIQHRGTDLFPGYGLDPDADYRPRKSLADIIRVFAGHKSGWGMAFWFLSGNSFLGGRRPQDVLARDPAKVIAAAEDEIQPICHG